MALTHLIRYRFVGQTETRFDEIGSDTLANVVWRLHHYPKSCVLDAVIEVRDEARTNRTREVLSILADECDEADEPCPVGLLPAFARYGVELPAAQRFGEAA